VLDQAALSERAISIRQPWAWAIIHAGKDVENPSEAAMRFFRPAIGKRVYIHAGKMMADDGYAFAVEFMAKIGVTPPMREQLAFGSIIGSVLVTGIALQHSSPWFMGPAAMVLADARSEPFRPVRGAQGLFRVG
jgi:hypothetical protein